MKAKKRTNRPAKWDTPTLLHRFAVCRKWPVNYSHLADISATNLSDARRKAFLMFTKFEVGVFPIDVWRQMVEDAEAEKALAKRTKKQVGKPGKLLEEPAPLTEEQRRESRRRYEQMKADYLAGLPVKCSEKLKKQFEAFRPREHVPIAVLSDLETTHRTKPIGKHKWRPLQSGLDMDRVCSLIEHEHDNDHETA